MPFNMAGKNVLQLGIVLKNNMTPKSQIFTTEAHNFSISPCMPSYLLYYASQYFVSLLLFMDFFNPHAMYLRLYLQI